MAQWCYMPTQISVNISSGNGLLPNRTKPLRLISECLLHSPESNFKASSYYFAQCVWKLYFLKLDKSPRPMSSTRNSVRKHLSSLLVVSILHNTASCTWHDTSDIVPRITQHYFKVTVSLFYRILIHALWIIARSHFYAMEYWPRLSEL